MLQTTIMLSVNHTITPVSQGCAAAKEWWWTITEASKFEIVMRRITNSILQCGGNHPKRNITLAPAASDVIGLRHRHTSGPCLGARISDKARTENLRQFASCPVFALIAPSLAPNATAAKKAQTCTNRLSSSEHSIPQQ